MKLSIILFALGLKLRWSQWRDAGFRKQIRRMDRVVVIRSEDGSAARSFIFRGDRLKIAGGVHPEATTELVWRDTAVAVKAMLSTNPLDTFSALGRGDMAILGNIQDALWFSDFVDQYR